MENSAGHEIVPGSSISLSLKTGTLLRSSVRMFVSERRFVGLWTFFLPKSCHDSCIDVFGWVVVGSSDFCYFIMWQVIGYRLSGFSFLSVFKMCLGSGHTYALVKSPVEGKAGFFSQIKVLRISSSHVSLSLVFFFHPKCFLFPLNLALSELKHLNSWIAALGTEKSPYVVSIHLIGLDKIEYKIKRRTFS